MSHTHLNDKEALILIDALAKNTKLTELKLTGNNISSENIKKIEEKLKENSEKISYVEVKKNARILAQAERTSATFFSSLPRDCLIKIAALTKNTSDDLEKFEKVASDHFCKPT